MEYYKNLSLEDIVYVDDNGVACVEEWRDIADYEGIYTASNLGRIKSLSRYKNHSSGNFSFLSKEKIIKQSERNDDYLCLGLHKNSIRTSFLTHHLIALAFLNHNHKGSKLAIDHIDNNKKNNTVCNLQIITSRENSSKDRHNKTGFTGVYEYNNKYMATIRKQNKPLNLGYYDTPEEASEKYQEAVSLIKQSKDITHLIRERLNKNGFTGVCKNKNRFQAKIIHKGKFYNLGNYDTQEEAGQIYFKALELSKKNKSFDYLINRYKSQTKAKGVYVSGNKFRVRFYSNGKNIELGTYDTLEEACQKKLEYEIKHGIDNKYIQ